MKKFMAFFMLISMFSVQADVVAQGGLKTIFDELNYSLTVEWDQKDQEFYQTQVAKFQAELKKLQAQGLSNQELIDFSLKNVKNQKFADDLKGLIGVVQANKLDQAEARKLVLDTVGKSYVSGASWTGDAAMIAVVALVLVLVIVAAAAAPASGGYGYGYGSTCYDDYVCFDYYDSWGWYWYSDCYWQTYCY
jgi:hypothetical protein